MAAVAPEEYQQADAGSDQEACYHLTGSQKTVQIKLGDDDGSCAVGDEADQGGQEDAEDGLAGQKAGYGILAQSLHKDGEHQGD